VDLGAHGKIKATAVNVSKGDRTTLSMRPERIQFSSKKPAASKPSLPAKVLELIYLGDHIRCRMDVAGNEEFIVKVPNSSLSSDLKPGVKGHVSWNTEDCRALDFAG